MQNCYSESLRKSLEIAKTALDLDIDKRLKKFSIFLRFERTAKSKDIPKRKVMNVKYITPGIKKKKIKKASKSPIHKKRDIYKNGKTVESNPSFENNNSLMSLFNITRQFCSIQ